MRAKGSKTTRRTAVNIFLKLLAQFVFFLLAMHLNTACGALL